MQMCADFALTMRKSVFFQQSQPLTALVNIYIASVLMSQIQKITSVPLIFSNRKLLYWELSPQ